MICRKLAKKSVSSDNAGIAQLVERNLAKVEVASSSLVSRSKLNQAGVSRALSLQRQTALRRVNKAVM
jgi:hypothetical protein